MKRVFVNEKWCLGCHLCEYNCAFAATGEDNMALALKDKEIHPKIRVEDDGKIMYAVSCRHCEDPKCVKSCISGALSKGNDGVVRINKDVCIGCLTCILACPYGALAESGGHAAVKCELCTDNKCSTPACVSGCPNNAICFEEREL